MSEEKRPWTPDERGLYDVGAVQRLRDSAEDLFEALEAFMGGGWPPLASTFDNARAAIAKALGKVEK